MRGGGTEVGRGGGRLYTYRYTVTTRMTSALRWAAMRAILMFHNCEGQSHKTVSTDHNLWRERRAEADSNWGPSAYQPNALPLGPTGSHFHRESIALIWPHWLTGRKTPIYLLTYHRLQPLNNTEESSSQRGQTETWAHLGITTGPSL